MPIYSNVENVLVTLPLIASATNISSSDITEFLDRAGTTINAKLARLYTVPLSNVPILETIETDLACYRLLAHRIFTQEKNNESTWPDKFKESMDLLDEIASGDIPLVSSSGDLIVNRTDTMEVYSTTMDYKSTFHEASIYDTIIDPEKIDDILDDRGLRS